MRWEDAASASKKWYFWLGDQRYKMCVQQNCSTALVNGMILMRCDLPSQAVGSSTTTSSINNITKCRRDEDNIVQCRQWNEMKWEICYTCRYLCLIIGVWNFSSHFLITSCRIVPTHFTERQNTVWSEWVECKFGQWVSLKDERAATTTVTGPLLVCMSSIVNCCCTVMIFY